MRVEIVDNTHIKIVASEAEVREYSNYTRVLIDSQRTFVCNSEPSSAALAINRPSEGSLFNTNLEISPRFTTDDFLIVFLELNDMTYPYVMPCYDNEKLLYKVASKTGVLDTQCDCSEDFSGAHAILQYYGFKLALSILDIQRAIKFWNRITGTGTKNISSCNCHGH